MVHIVKHNKVLSASSHTTLPSRGKTGHAGHMTYVLRTAIATFVVGAALIPAAPAQATVGSSIRGSVACKSGAPVLSIRVDSSEGGSGPVTPVKRFPSSSVAYYNKPLTLNKLPSSVSVLVGCGSTSSTNPASSHRSSAKYVTSSSGYVYNMWCDDGTASGRCGGGAVMSGRTYNPGYAGECTWGASYMWRKASRDNTYPTWNGNAHQWNENASAQGYSVVSYPRERSIGVYEKNIAGAGSAGHVVWVTKVWLSGSDIMFNVVEMNWPSGAGWRMRNNIKWVTGMSFIVGPSGTPVTSW